MACSKNYKEIKKCPKCGCPIEKIVTLPGFNITMKVPIICMCKKKELEQKKINEERVEKKDKLKILFKNSLINEKFKKNTFENWDHTIAPEKRYEFALNYVKNFKYEKENNEGLFLYGEPGTGKTFMCDCIANALIKKYVSVIDTKVSTFLSRIQNTYDTMGKETPEYIINKLYMVDLMILDDFGTENVTPWSKKMLYQILDFRLNNSLPTIMTSNYSIEYILANYPNRITSRLFQACKTKKISGNDLRLLYMMNSKKN